MFSLLSILPFALAVYAQSDCARIYTVVTGDICDAISVVHNSSTFAWVHSCFLVFLKYLDFRPYSYQLAAANPEINADCSNLFPGEVRTHTLPHPLQALLKYRRLNPLSPCDRLSALVSQARTARAPPLSPVGTHALLSLLRLALLIAPCWRIIRM